MKKLKFEAPFIILTIGEFLSNILTSVTGIILTFAVLDHTGSAAQSSIMLAITYLPSLPAMLLSSWIDRIPVMLPLVLCNVLRAVSLLGVFAVLRTSTGDYIIYSLYLAGILNGLLGALYIPSYQRAVPRLVPSELLANATGIASAIAQVATLVGLALSGPIIVLLGSTHVLVYEAGILICTAGIFLLVRIPPGETVSEEHGGLNMAWRSLRASRLTLSIPFIAFFVNSTFALILAKMPMQLKSLGLGEGAFGMFEVALILGLILGAGLFQLLVRGISNLRDIIIVGMAGALLTLFVMSWFDTQFVVLALLNSVLGLSLAVVNNAIQVMIAVQIPESMHGRVYSIFYTSGQLGIPVTLLVSTLFIDSVHLSTLLVINSSVIALVLLTFVIYVRRENITPPSRVTQAAVD